MKNQTPPSISPTLDGFICYGYGPLKVQATGVQMLDVAATIDGTDWSLVPHCGNSEFNYYALRKGSEIARLNGLEDKKESTMKIPPANIPTIPNDTIFYGNGPLKIEAIPSSRNDVFALIGSSWSPGWKGDGAFYYALRKNSEIAKLNGLTNTETIMKTQPHTKQMKLKLQVLNDDEIQVPSDMVAFRIVEQEGFADCKVYESDEHTFRSIYLPDFCDEGKKITFYLRGAEKNKDNRIMVIPRAKYEKLVAAIDSLLKKENAPKILYTATFFYKNEKNGSQKRRMIEVITENDTHLAGNDKDDGGKYKNFLKANVIGAIDKVKS